MVVCVDDCTNLLALYRVIVPIDVLPKKVAFADDNLLYFNDFKLATCSPTCCGSFKDPL